MKKNILLKCFVSIILIILLLTGCSFATQEEDYTTSTQNEVMPISEEGETTPIHENTNTENNLKEQDIHVGDYFSFASDIRITEPVDGNVYVFGENIEITTIVDGNVFAIGNQVTISKDASVYGSVFLSATDASIDGIIYDLYSATKTLTIGNDGFVVRDMKSSSESIHLYGKVRRDAYINASNLEITTTANEPSIGGTLSYSTPKELSLPDGIVLGSVIYHPNTHIQDNKEIFQSYFSNFLYTLAYALIIILLIGLFAPKFSQKTGIAISKKLLPSIGFGAISIVAIPVICIILIVTIIGIPAAIALIAFYALLLSIAMAIVGMSIARFICTKWNKNSKLIFILLSILMVSILWGIAQIPTFGIILHFLIMTLGLGITLNCIFHKDWVIDTSLSDAKEEK